MLVCICIFVVPSDVSVSHSEQETSAVPSDSSAHAVDLPSGSSTSAVPSGSPASAVGLPSGSSPSTNGATEFSPSSIRPLPQAPARLSNSKRGRPKRKCAVLTDTPVKQALELEQTKGIKSLKKCDNSRGQKKGKSKAKRRLDLPRSNSNIEECYCLVCAEPYSNSKDREKWVMCVTCKNWSHEECTMGEEPYICHNCDSD